jgi:hypothetical protein
VASSRGRRFWPWFGLGFVLWPVALVALFASTDLSRPTEVRLVQSARVGPNRLDELHRLTALRDARALTDEEFEREKGRILNS